MTKDEIIELLASDLEQAVDLMREHASTVGPMHSWWEHVADFEAHLKSAAAERPPVQSWPIGSTYFKSNPLIRKPKQDPK